MRYLVKAAVLMVVLFVIGLLPGNVAAQAVVQKSSISIESFTGTYHLSRDSAGHSLLNSEEVILADFPSGGNFSGITRSIPESYQGHSVQVKVTDVTDASGAPVPYKTKSSGDDLVITTGDPSITLYGSQTFRINYQTRGVIDIKSSSSTFLLDINGRGWDQPIGQVSAAIYMPLSFVASLIGKPDCYLGYLNSINNNCTADSHITDGQIVVTAKTDRPVTGHQTLAVKLNFKAATFINQKSSNNIWWLTGGTITITVLGSAWYFLKRR